MDILNLTFTQKDPVLVFPFNQENLLIPSPGDLADLDQIIAVNETGLIFWHELISGKTPNEICDKWNRQTGIDLEELRQIACDMIYILLPILEESRKEDQA